MADFQNNLAEFEKENMRIAAGSVDPEDKTREMNSEMGLKFPIGVNLDMKRVVKTIGGFFEAEKKFLEPSGFLIRPDEKIEVACYSSGPLGRFQAGNILALVRYYKKHRDQASG